ncbi:MAG TPA: CHAT domain-containing protein [Thermoanaerobaculia bacterium]|nr:CHAT domain-containing protein [Thermoanaerobaculia bacterium]
MGALLLAGALLARGPLRAEETRPAEPDRAEALVDAAAAHIAGERMAEAEAALGEALPLFQARQDRRGEAFCRLLQGLADTAAGRDGAAVANLEQSLPVLEESGELMTAWLVHVTLAELEKRNGRTEKAIARYEQALAVVARIERAPARLSLEGLERLGKVFGVPAIDLSQLGSVAPFVLPILVRFAEAAIRDGYAGALIEANRLEQAETELARAAELSQLFGGLLDGSLAVHRGDLRRRQWKFDEAKREYERALASPLPPHPGGAEQEVLRVLGRLAEIEVLSGRLEPALAWNDKALVRVRDKKDRKREAAVLQDRAELCLRGGRMGEAERLLRQALAIAVELGDRYRQVSVLSDLGLLAVLRGDVQAAVEHLEKADSLGRGLDEPFVMAGVRTLRAEAYVLGGIRGEGLSEEAARQAAQSDFRLAEALMKMLEAYDRLGSGEDDGGELEKRFAEFWDLAEAEVPGVVDAGTRALILEALRMQRGAQPAQPVPEPGPAPVMPHAAAFSTFLRGRLHAVRGEWAAARELWTRAFEEASRLEHRDFAAGMSAAVGVAYWKEGMADLAIKHLSRAADLLREQGEEFRVEELLAAYLGGERRWFFEILVELLAREGRGREAFERAEEARAQTLLRLLGSQRLRARDGADTELVSEAEALRMAMTVWERDLASAEGLQQEALREDLSHARLRYEQLLPRLKVTNPGYALIRTVTPPTVEQVQRELPPDTTLISYFVTGSTTHAWVVDRESFRYVALPLGAAELRRAAEIWKGGPAGASRGAKRDDEKGSVERRAEDLYQGLFAPLVPCIRHRRLLIVPHGPLHYVPFAALREKASGRYLIEDYTLAYAPSTSVLPFLRRETAIAGRALVLGAPAVRDRRLGQLPAAREEAAAVARLFGTEPLLDREARESRLYELGGGVDLLHVAAHGLYEAKSPLFSRLALAPGDGHDGNLEVHEIFAGLDLDGVDLVVLSACRTAEGEPSGGDEITGLTRAFLYAGTPAVISTLWDIDDAASALLMEEFYRRLLEGVPVAEALQQAQISLRHHPRYEAPFFWAAFSLTGDPRGQWLRATSAR